MTQHTAMLWLPDALEAAGVEVRVLPGWDSAQGNYKWTNIDSGAQSYEEEPTCFMIHHTATSGYTPSVGEPNKWSKANCWAGLWRDGRLYQSGGGVPTIVFTSAGPARISSGYGHGPTLHDVAADIRVPWDQSKPDTDMAANRYAWNVETVHEGDGSDLDAGVEHALVVMGALICDRFGWSPWRTIGHLTWTTRKIDPYWDGRKDVIVHIQDAVAEMMEEEPVPETSLDVEKWQNYLNRWMVEHAPGNVPVPEDGVYGETTRWRTQSFQIWAGLEVNGEWNTITQMSMALVIKPEFE